MSNNLTKIVFSIPTYKRELDLIRLLCSISCSLELVKDLVEISICIRDNDPNSNLSEKYLRNYCKDCYLIYTKNEFNEGARFNVWRTLVKSSQFGDYICLVSDDDYILPDFLKIVYESIRNEHVDYLVTNYYFQFPNLKASNKQYGLETPILKNKIYSPKEDIIISNRILTGTVFSKKTILKMINLCPRSFYEYQWYVQFLGCFANSYKRLDERISIHQVLNKTYWEQFDKDKYSDMVISRLEGYKYAYKLNKSGTKDLKNLILKTIINYPIWYGLKVLFDRKQKFYTLIFDYFKYKIFHLKIGRDIRMLLNSLKSKLINKK